MPYFRRELLGKLRGCPAVSPLSDAFEEGQPVTLGQKAGRAEPFRFESDDGSTGGGVVGIDWCGGPRSEQRAQTGARTLFDNYNPAARREHPERFAQRRDTLLRTHARQQTVLIVDDDEVEGAVFERKVIELTCFELEKKSEFFCSAPRSFCVRVIGHDRADTPAQPRFYPDRSQQRRVSTSHLQ